MRSGGHQQQPLGALARALRERVAAGFHSRTLTAHARDDHRVAFPRAAAQLVPHLLATDDLELLAELLEDLVLPPGRQRRRRTDQAPVDDPAHLQLLQEQPGHDRLTCTRIVSQHEAQPRLRRTSRLGPEPVLADWLRNAGQCS